MTDKLPKEIAARIKAVRGEKHLTQEEVADKAGISRTYFVLIEQGKKNPTATVLFAIIAALGVSKKDILGK